MKKQLELEDGLLRHYLMLNASVRNNSEIRAQTGATAKVGVHAFSTVDTFALGLSRETRFATKTKQKSPKRFPVWNTG